MNTYVTQDNTLAPNQSTTANGAVTNVSSLSKNIDLFFVAGSSRRNSSLEQMFNDALRENNDLAVRIMQWARDVRGGAGERQAFRRMLGELIKYDANLAVRILDKTPELGRWDDLFVAFGTPCERHALRMIASGLRSENQLCAKWMPRKGPNANKIRSYLKLTPKAYRRLIVGLTNVVEQDMCAKRWSDIKYSAVPSVASARYQKAFSRNDGERYGDYIEGLKAGTETINSSVVYPYDVVRSLWNGDVDVASAQWDSLPDYLNGSTENILPIVDVSGSMGCSVSGSVTAMDVAISLGLYLSERNRGAFQDCYMTFSETPSVVVSHGSLFDRYQNMSRAHWGMSTNIELVFKELLKSAKANSAKKEDMPSVIVILSDMEFNCVKSGKDQTVYDSMKLRYSRSGYELPTVVFWNLNGREGNVPVTMLENGTCLVSGFSPAIMKTLLANLSSPSAFTPLSVMLDAVNTERYNY